MAGKKAGNAGRKPRKGRRVKPGPYRHHVPWRFKTRVALPKTWRQKPEIRRGFEYLQERPPGTEITVRGLTLKMSAGGSVLARKFIKPETLEGLRKLFGNASPGTSVRLKGIVFTKTRAGIRLSMPEIKAAPKARRLKRKKRPGKKGRIPAFAAAKKRAEKPGDIVKELTALAKKRGIKFRSRNEMYKKLGLMHEEAFEAEVDAVMGQVSGRLPNLEVIWGIARQNLAGYKLRGKQP